MVLVRGVALLLLLLSTASCASAAGEAEVGIVPPDGWERVDSKGTNLLAAWRDPSAKTLVQNLTLGREDDPQGLDAYVAAAAKALANSLPGSAPAVSKITICTNETAYVLVGVGNARGVRVRIEELLTQVGRMKVIGTYTRPDAAPQSAEAEAALRTICPRV